MVIKQNLNTNNMNMVALSASLLIQDMRTMKEIEKKHEIKYYDKDGSLITEIYNSNGIYRYLNDCFADLTYLMTQRINSPAYLKKKLPTELNNIHLSIIIHLSRMEDCTITDLNKHIILPKSSLTRYLNELMDMDFITREKREGNKRNVYLGITQKCNEYMTGRQKIIYDNFVEQAQKHLSEDEMVVMAQMYKAIIEKVRRFD